MPKYLIERDAPGLGGLSQRDLQAMALKSNRVLGEVGGGIQWQHSYVTDDKLCCVYISPNEDLIRAHAERGAFPLTRINRIQSMMDPTTAEAAEAANGVSA